jgi:hypothetical protein
MGASLSFISWCYRNAMSFSDVELERIRAQLKKALSGDVTPAKLLRLQERLREYLGRDLTPEEYRFLGLSNVVLPGAAEDKPTQAKDPGTRRK